VLQATQKDARRPGDFGIGRRSQLIEIWLGKIMGRGEPVRGFATPAVVPIAKPFAPFFEVSPQSR
jgi:hypothetical protein